MYNRLSQQMTILGLCAMAFYALMLASGTLSIEVMPQFIISAVIFLSSGRVMKKAARRLRASRTSEEEEEQPRRRIDWGLLNWVAGICFLSVLLILLIVPLGSSLQDSFIYKLAQQLFHTTHIP